MSFRNLEEQSNLNNAPFFVLSTVTFSIKTKTCKDAPMEPEELNMF